MVLVPRLVGYIFETGKILMKLEIKKKKGRIEVTKRDVKRQVVQASKEILRTKMYLAVENRSFQPWTRPVSAGSRSFIGAGKGGGPGAGDWVEGKISWLCQDGLFPDICPQKPDARKENARQSGGQKEGAEPGK